MHWLAVAHSSPPLLKGRHCAVDMGGGAYFPLLKHPAIFSRNISALAYAIPLPKPHKNFLKNFQKRLDIWLGLCYNSITERVRNPRERGNKNDVQ